jgi:fructose-specific PTS system IIC-like component
MSRSGVDFDAEDGELSRLIILILIPEDDHNAQVEILADISRTFHEPKAVEQVLRANTYTEFLSLLKANSFS